MKLSDYVMDFLARQGLRHLFLLPGGGCMHLVDSAGRNSAIEYICCLHEQACAYASEAYAEFGNQLGAALVTTGPGATNAMTGLAAAWLESASCLFISGQAKRADMIGKRGVRSMGPQEVDVVSMVKPVTKYAVSVDDPATIRHHLEKAVYLAAHGRRGPVWIEIPLDIQAAQIEESSLSGFVPPNENAAKSLAEQVSASIQIWNKAERPAIFLGNGARGAAQAGLIDELIERLGAPVLTTWKAIDFLAEDHPLFAGRPGSVGQRGANFTQQTADCLLVIGARLDLPQTAFDHRNFAPRAAKIVVDVDGPEIRKLGTDIALPICADAMDFVSEFLRQSENLEVRDHSAWVAKTKEWQQRYPSGLPEWQPPAGMVDYYRFIGALSQVASMNDVLVPGSSGPGSDIFMQAFRVKRGQRILNSPGLGAMGTGVPASIGACIASGRRNTICVNGDGGFQLNIQELETIRRLNLPIKFFVLCNGGYASIMGMQKNHFQGHFVASEPSSGLTLPDVTKIADAYGIPTARIDRSSGMEKQIAEIMERRGPVVCAVMLSPDQPVAPKVSSKLDETGVMVTAPMEDMWPFLSREEMQAVMSVAGVRASK